MSFPFDATLKEIVREHAADYAAAFDLPRDQPTTVLNVDLSTLSAATDVGAVMRNPLRSDITVVQLAPWSVLLRTIQVNGGFDPIRPEEYRFCAASMPIALNSQWRPSTEKSSATAQLVPWSAEAMINPCQR